MNVQQVAKAIVAVAAFVGVLATQLAGGSIDINEIVTAGIALLGALGVWAVPNAPKPQRGEVVVASTPDA